MSPIDSAALVLYRWFVGNFRLSCTVRKLLDIFAGALNLAVILPLKQTFVNVTFEMTPFPTFSDRTLCVLPRCTFSAIKHSDSFLMCRDTRVNV